MKKIAILLSITGASGCGIRTPPVPPDWNEETCEPSDRSYIDMAHDKQDKPPPIEPGTATKQAREDTLKRLESLGYRLTIGRPPGYNAVTDLSHNPCGITLPGHVYISQECFDQKGDDHLDWVRFLRHEEVHARQQTRMGAYFFLVYTYAEGRLLGIETPAYDEEYYTHHFFMTDDPSLELEMPDADNMKLSAELVYKKYSGTHIPMKCFSKIAPSVWGVR